MGSVLCGSKAFIRRALQVAQDDRRRPAAVGPAGGRGLTCAGSSRRTPGPGPRPGPSAGRRPGRHPLACAWEVPQTNIVFVDVDSRVPEAKARPVDHLRATASWPRACTACASSPTSMLTPRAGDAPSTWRAYLQDNVTRQGAAMSAHWPRKPHDAASQITNTDALVRVIEHREIFHDEMFHADAPHHERRDVSMIAAPSVGLRVKKENHRRDHGGRAGDARVRRPCRSKTSATSSTCAAQAAIRRTPSTSPRPRCSSPAASARVSKHAAAVSARPRQRRRAGGAGRPMTCLAGFRRWPSAWPRPASASCSRPTTTPAMEACRARAPRAGRAHHLQHPRPLTNPAGAPTS